MSILELLMELLYCASVTTSEKGIQLGNEYRQAVIEHKALTRCLVRNNNNNGIKEGYVYQ